MRARPDQRAEGEAGLQALLADAAHGPAAVVDRMIGLNRGDDVLFLEPRNRVRLHMLDLFDAEAPVARAVGPGDGGERAEERRVGKEWVSTGSFRRAP